MKWKKQAKTDKNEQKQPQSKNKNKPTKIGITTNEKVQKWMKTIKTKWKYGIK